MGSVHPAQSADNQVGHPGISMNMLTNICQRWLLTFAFQVSSLPDAGYLVLLYLLLLAPISACLVASSVPAKRC